MNNSRLGRELDIEALNHAKNKVTLGFKCDAEIKLELILEAQENDITLSNYIESLVLKRNDKEVRNEDLYTQEELDQVANDLNDEIVFYEHPKLYMALKKYRGQELPYTTEDGVPKKLKIESEKDIYTVFINNLEI